MTCLACPVRRCGEPLSRQGAQWRCPRGHSFDVARRGYVNLLQPQDRKAAAPGDTRAAVEARAALLAAGIGAYLIDAVIAQVEALPVDRGVALDIGAGTGDLLGRLAGGDRWSGVGLDLSTPAVEHAARAYPAVTWVVANADRRLPLLDGSVDLVLSAHARRNPGECARVLRPGGWLIVAVPAADDLIEVRAAVQGRGVSRDRMPALVVEHAGAFTLVRQVRAEERRWLGGTELRWLLQATYRGARAAESARVASLDALEMTLASDIGVFARTTT